ncbi:protein of unknown function DUF1549 [Isosphaera pallida ATCC 43644]|uniref:Cytochrome c domain-containing protein n=1 Tax=Isosphaera pallida (strain ATCC 43644 / DSM 9630 / IS1B) TaxID=575540 RepID=E8R3N1_ISOPI|nr:PSD1 and planctomycete cytochrome C domain-containing protein [Isosphaera pallida]ADV62616.1 protein of unknown function DUF1549 [Isosphaera pallida ATCC 43644]
MHRRSPIPPRRRAGLVLAILLLDLFSWRCFAQDATKPDTSRTDNLAVSALALLEARCVKCHSAVKSSGGLRVDSRAALLQGGDGFGPAIEPGHAEESPLIHRVEGRDGEERMPPESSGPPLDADEIDLLRRWIDAGAVWPADSTTTQPQPQTADHWAFRPIVRPVVPERDGGGRAIHPIDALIEARLEREGITPVGPADRRTLLRRLAFDLTGLPPTPEELDAFENDPDPDAYERRVESYLASPAYGERWARHWLDVVRFAESTGFETNQPRPRAWPYRDWVIAAFNADLPFDQFIRAQIAGDTLDPPHHAATGFLVAGPEDQVKSPDPGLTARQRADELFDMAAVTGTAFLGLTVGCARCHSHKFDPISQREATAIVAALAGVRHGERPWNPQAEALNGPGVQERLARRAALRRQLDDQLISWLAAAPLASPPPLADSEGRSPAVPRPPVDAGETVDRFAPVIAQALRFRVNRVNNGTEPCLDELEVWGGDPDTPSGPLMNLARRDDVRIDASGTYPNSLIHRLDHLNDGVYGNSRSWISDTPNRGWVRLTWNRPVRIEAVAWSRDRSVPRVYNDRVAVEYVIEVAERMTNQDDPEQPEPSWRVVASSWDRATETDHAEPSAEFIAATNRRDQLRRDLAGLEPPATIYAGRFEQPTQATRRFHRGDPTQPREPVPPGGIAALGVPFPLQVQADDAVLPEAHARRALADWIAHPDQVLPARVIVNRLWRHHFGRGLVTTPDDFGRNGAPPSHPELLDWLADELKRQGMRLKPIHRAIVTSAAYRRASTYDPTAAARDRDAALLWRYPPRRLEAEAIRDAMLAVSGELNRDAGGPGFDLFEPNTNYVKVYTPRSSFGPDEFRRMIYWSKPRMRLDDVFGGFDCPDAGQPAPNRTSSTTPLQALALWNSPFALGRAEALARRIERETGPQANASQQVERAFRLTLGRAPRPEEQAEAVALVERFGLAALARVLFNTNKFLFIF